MRKITFMLVILLAITTSSIGQIKVNNTGRAFFGPGTSTSNYGAINLNADGSTYGISWTGTSTNRYNIFKFNNDFYISPTASTTKGIKMGSTGGISIANSCLNEISTTSSLLTFYTTGPTGITLFGDYASSGKELIKAVIDNSNTSNIGYAVYRTDNIVGIHERTFYVNGAGTVYAKNGYIQSSDATNKEGIVPLKNSLDKISALSAISFYYKDSPKKTVESLNDYQLKANLEEDSTNISTVVRAETIEQMKTEAHRKRIGLIAQEVEKIVPEVVRTMEDGKKGIMYSDLVSLLIEGIKELKEVVDEKQNHIDELKDRLDNIEKEIATQVTGYKNYNEEIKLLQNSPNPFNRETEIKYQIPEGSDGYISIYNLNGLQLKKYPIQSAQGSILISATEFQAGIYIYSLIIGNQEIDSKRMILID